MTFITLHCDCILEKPELLKIRHGAFTISVFLRLSIMSGTYAKLLLLKDAQVLCLSHSEPQFCKWKETAFAVVQRGPMLCGLWVI